MLKDKIKKYILKKMIKNNYLSEPKLTRQTCNLGYETRITS